MTPSRRHFLGTAASAAALPVLARRARAQGFPSRPIHFIVGFPAGSGPDIVARIIGDGMGRQLGQTFVVEDRPGASSNLATADVAHAPADGYMILMVTTANVINATLYQKLDYSFMRDIAPVASLDREPFVLDVTPSLPVKTVPELIAYAKANPGKVTMASAGIGSAPHLFGQLFQNLAGIEMTHVPYRGNPLPDMLSGQVQVFFGPIQSSLEYIRTGKLRALAVTTTKRSFLLPDLPTIAETLPGYDAEGWLGIGAPKNTPPDVIAKLHAAMNGALADSAVKTKLEALGDTVAPATTAEFAKLVNDEYEKWGKVIRDANIKVE
jgi:tripartite-type tricarboxylate transporter receptor subunit TctC